ncbi:hypothetical protein GCM10011348_37920 [Marinobacterium nitratireducens]|uniref:Ankyrin repeat domain-containing protein n=1 Tax=Marinobacterium nitratireducens TaxID=518897 RepID=A0A918DX33_9GAMM|nr:hypothetical protein [Marinobacterium nitratireducens]GGO86638.1 hypothetical protein GCM10011348_37920 [Marinobacterium nitratireducens]
MLNPFRDSRPEKLLKALEQNDEAALVKVVAKTDAEFLGRPLRDGYTAAELAIRAGRPKLLAQLLAAGADANGSGRDGRSLLYCALQQPEASLALLDALLLSGADPNSPAPEEPPALHLCFDQCPPHRLMLHLSRLLQAGADIDARAPDGLSLIERAILTQRRELIHFVIHSGCAFPERAPGSIDADTWDYALRCRQDYRIRQQFLAP